MGMGIDMGTEPVILKLPDLWFIALPNEPVAELPFIFLESITFLRKAEKSPATPSVGPPPQVDAKVYHQKCCKY